MRAQDYNFSRIFVRKESVSTLYPLLDLPNKEMELFYHPMGHSKEINGKYVSDTHWIDDIDQSELSSS